VHEVHSGKKKNGAIEGVVDRLSVVDRSCVDTPDRDCVFYNLSTRIERISTAVAQYVDRPAHAIDRHPTRELVSSVCRRAH